MLEVNSIGIIGLGYVGLPLGHCFVRAGFKVIGFDINPERIGQLKEGMDLTREVRPEELKNPLFNFTNDENDLGSCDVLIVTVPTPIDANKNPDLAPLLAASATAGRQLKPGMVVSYESTVFPGATEDECIPILEKESGLQAGKDFWVGYSPERVNPGDPDHGIGQIVKVVSGQTLQVCDHLSALYAKIVPVGIHRAPDIKTAEAAKVIENTQRDLNIALMNELSIIFEKMGLDTLDVLEAARTKWNFVPFSPGLVGGHCIGVDPYYLTEKAERLGYHPEVILSGRRINDSMGKFIAQKCVKEMIKLGQNIKGSKATVLGLTFKPDIPDVRNTMVVPLIREMEAFGMKVQVSDPNADPNLVKQLYGIDLIPADELSPAKTVVLAVPHKEFLGNWGDLAPRFSEGSGFFADIKGAYSRENRPSGISHWRL